MDDDYYGMASQAEFDALNDALNTPSDYAVDPGPWFLGHDVGGGMASGAEQDAINDALTDAVGGGMASGAEQDAINAALGGAQNLDEYYGGATPEEQAAINSALQAAGLSKINIPTSLWNAIKGAFTGADGKTNWGMLGGVGGALLSMSGLGKAERGGYKGSIPQMAAVRQQIAYNDPNRRPGEGGRRYFTDTRYVAPGDVAAAKEAAATEAQGILAGYTPRPAPTASNFKFKSPWEKAAPAATIDPVNVPAALPAVPNAAQIAEATFPKTENKLAAGGVARMKEPRYLRGITDGMEDKIDTTIDDQQRAKLSHGEFVIPADVVSHLGNGNSEAGAKKLYQMMDRIRVARTGTKQQGRQINPDKFMPGGKVGYQSGGIVAFQSGGVTPANTTTESNLSNWAGDYVTSTLGKAQAAADQPYQAYQGPLTAGASDLQTSAFSGIKNLAETGYTPTQFSADTFDAGQAAKYMNPYLSAALDPQLKELRRQAQISNLGTLAKAGASGIMGGARRDLMEAEGIRNLLGKQSEVIGKGYADAYDKAMGQFNTEQNRGLDVDKASEASRQFSANFGRNVLGDMLTAGGIQRGIESEGIAADKAEFENQRDWDMKMQQYKLGLLQKLPVEAQSTSPNTNVLSDIMSNSGTILKFLQTLGLAPTTSTATGGSAGTTGNSSSAPVG